MKLGLSVRTISFQVVMYLLLQCLCVWIQSEARVNPSRRTKVEARKIQKRVHRTHKPCTVGSTEQLSDDPCDKCRCVNGITRCHKTHCPNHPITCVDASVPSDGCCTNPTCPNGPNCWHNGEKINGRRRHKHKDYSTGCVEVCSCPAPWKVTYNSDIQADCRKHCPIRRPTK